eukprot:184011-Prorocentrum_minimum.AAC.1
MFYGSSDGVLCVSCAPAMCCCARRDDPTRKASTKRIFPLPSLDWVIQQECSLSPHAIGSYNGNVPSPLTRLGHTPGIFPLPSLDWVIHQEYWNIPSPLARLGHTRVVRVGRG